jgi:hypothetical protein
MANTGKQLIDNLAWRRQLNRWRRAERQVAKVPLSELRQLHNQARMLRTHLDGLLYQAGSRLALPRLGSNAITAPFGSDWTWRPELWRGPLPVPGIAAAESRTSLGSEVTLYHDCAQSEVTLRQLRNTREGDLAPYGLWLDVLEFEGSYLSLVLDLPGDAVTGLQRRHLVRADTIVQVERPLEIFARLNVKHGPNTEQIVQEIKLNDDVCAVEFDLAYSNLNEKRVERVWMDLIFEGPRMNRLAIRDLTLSRRPRADL